MAKIATYEKTHPWIRFELDLRQADYRLWLQLGEAQAKSEQIVGVPLLPEVADYLHQILLAKGALATTAIEGNTLSEEEALKIVQGDSDLPPSKEYLGQEIENIVNASNMVADKVLDGSLTRLTLDWIRELNTQILHGLPPKRDVHPGHIRVHEVGVGRYRGAPPQDCEYLLERLCNWLNGDSFLPDKELDIASGILKAIIAHLYIAWIHPFGDGNGRTARLMECQFLLSCGIPMAAAHLLSNHYNQTRTEYYRQLDIASSSGGEVIPFVTYALQGLIDGLDEQIQMIKNQQFYVHWINHVHNQFRDKDSPTQIRRRRLVIDLTESTKPIPIAELRHITPRIAEGYAGKTDRTIRRDVNALVGMGLLKRDANGVAIRRELMAAFVSPAVSGG